MANTSFTRTGDMKRIAGSEEALFGAKVSAPDSNRFYSILLDARASAASENMFDVAENLLHSEKENAKLSLEKLWALKKNLHDDSGNGTVDMLIRYYQEKIDVLRNKEEHIRKISTDSRKLLEDKRMKDSEVATVKQSISDCTRDLEEMQGRLKKLMVREQELTLIGTQLTKELLVNQNEVVNGLYEIILAQPQGFGAESSAGEALASSEPAVEQESKGTQPVSDSPQLTATLFADEHAAAAPEPDAREEYDAIVARANGDAEVSDDTESVAEDHGAPAEVPELPAYPKSVVKTTKGRIIGEYYYDAKVYKNKRHYIYNSRFFLDRLRSGVVLSRRKFDEGTHSDLLQMVQDAYRRVAENSSLHFEVSTNEMLNRKTLKDVWHSLKSRDYDELERFCSRLSGKMDALGGNYRAMLKEQMGRLVSD